MIPPHNQTTPSFGARSPTHNVKLNVERNMTPKAMTPDAKSPATGGSEVVMPDDESPAAGGSEVVTPDAKSLAAGGSEVVTPDAESPAAGGFEVVTPDAGHIVCKIDIFWRPPLEDPRS